MLNLYCSHNWRIGGSVWEAKSHSLMGVYALIRQSSIVRSKNAQNLQNVYIFHLKNSPHQHVIIQKPNNTKSM